MATVYAPIAYPPLPLLAFKMPEEGAGGRPRLAASGSLRSCDPDRIVLKKIVLSGYPVKASQQRGWLGWAGLAGAAGSPLRCKLWPPPPAARQGQLCTLRRGLGPPQCPPT